MLIDSPLAKMNRVVEFYRSSSEDTALRSHRVTLKSSTEQKS